MEANTLLVSVVCAHVEEVTGGSDPISNTSFFPTAVHGSQVSHQPHATNTMRMAPLVCLHVCDALTVTIQ